MKVILIDSFTIEPEWIKEAKNLAGAIEIRLVTEKREGASIPVKLLEDYSEIKVKKVFESVHQKELNGQALTTLVHRLQQEKGDPEFVLITASLNCTSAIEELRKEGINIRFAYNLKCVTSGNYLFQSLDQAILAKDLGFELYAEIEHELVTTTSFEDFKARTRAVLSEVAWVQVLSTIGRYKNSFWR